MKPRLETRLRALGSDRAIEDIVAVLEEYPRPADLHCLRYECSERAIWPPRGGQPQGFCSDGCRRRYLRERAQLEAQELELVACLGLPASVRKRRRVELAIVAVRWQLQRYPLVMPEPGEADPSV